MGSYLLEGPVLGPQNSTAPYKDPNLESYPDRVGFRAVLLNPAKLDRGPLLVSGQYPPRRSPGWCLRGLLVVSHRGLRSWSSWPACSVRGSTLA